MAKLRKRLRKAAKRIGRKHQKIASKAVKVVTPVLAAAGTVVGGPVVGAAITAAGAGVARVTGATAARMEGKRGRHARAAGRKLAKRTAIYGALGTTLGVGASLLAGGSALTGLAGTAALSGSAAKAVAPGTGGVVTEDTLSGPNAPAPWEQSIRTESDLYGSPSPDASNPGFFETFGGSLAEGAVRGALGSSVSIDDMVSHPPGRELGTGGHLGSDIGEALGEAVRVDGLGLPPTAEETDFGDQREGAGPVMGGGMLLALGVLAALSLRKKRAS